MDKQTETTGFHSVKRNLTSTSVAVIAVAASAGAALVHAALASAHASDGGNIAVAAFLGMAAAQLAAPLLAAAYGSWLWKTVAALNVIAIGAYGAAVLGLAPLLHEGPEEVSLLGILTVALEAVAILGSAFRVAPISTPPRLWAAPVALALVIAAASGVGFAPVHGHEESHATTEIVVTAEEQQRADALIAGTMEGVAGYTDVATAEADGYRWIGDGRRAGGYQHYVRADYLANTTILDPTQIESLVYQTQADGSLTLVSAMYILPPGKTMEDVPNVAGDLTVWHDHTNLCWRSDGTIAGAERSTGCPAGSTARPTPPMLHVWVVDNPDGPFAGILGHGTDQESTHTH